MEIYSQILAVSNGPVTYGEKKFYVTGARWKLFQSRGVDLMTLQMTSTYLSEHLSGKNKAQNQVTVAYLFPTAGG